MHSTSENTEEILELAPLSRTGKLSGEVRLPPDKSIAQRAVIISSVAKGKTVIKNFPKAGDPLSTLNAIRILGLEIIEEKNTLFCEGLGLDGLEETERILDFGNSGTGFRLTLGLLSGLPNGIFSVLTGDASLSKRPMKRITEPLIRMGAQIMGRKNASLAPIAVSGKTLDGGLIQTPVASAQLKSALLLSCLHGKNRLIIEEPAQSRNHTEIMLKSFGANISVNEDKRQIELSPSILRGTEIIIPGDASAAAFLAGAACIIPDSQVLLKGVGLNKTRTGFLRCLENMGAKIKIHMSVSDMSGTGELIGDIEIKSSELKGIEIYGDIVPNVIDEIPILALVASQAKGQTIIRDAKELRVKESDRIKALVSVLSNLGVDVKELDDGLVIQGKDKTRFEPKDIIFDSVHDHRIAMTISIAALYSTQAVKLKGAEWANISFPNFYETLKSLSK